MKTEEKVAVVGVGVLAAIGIGVAVAKAAMPPPNGNGPGPGIEDYILVRPASRAKDTETRMWVYTLYYHEEYQHRSRKISSGQWAPDRVMDQLAAYLREGSINKKQADLGSEQFLSWEAVEADVAADPKYWNPQTGEWIWKL